MTAQTPEPLAAVVTGLPMTLDPGKTYVLRCLRPLSLADADRIQKAGDRFGVKFVVLDESLEIVEEKP